MASQARADGPDGGDGDGGISPTDVELLQRGTIPEQIRILRKIAQGGRLARPLALVEGLRSPSPEVRQLSAWCARSGRDVSLVPALLPLLDDEHPDVRCVAAETLSEIGDPSAIPALVRVLHDPSPKVRMHTTWALWHLRASETLPQVRTLLHDSDVRVRVAAVTAVGRFVDPSNRDLLLSALKDPSDRVRRATILALRLLSHPDIAAEIRPFLSDPAKRVRIAAAVSLGELRDHNAVPLLMARWDSEETFVHPSILVALGRIGDPQAIPLVRRALREPQQWTVVCALWVVGTLRVREAREDVLQLTRANNRSVRGAAWENLGRLGDGRDLPLLQSALQSPEAWVRRGAALGLGHLGHREALTSLLPVLSDPDLEVRMAGAWAVGNLHEPAVIVPLLQLLENEAIPLASREGTTPEHTEEDTFREGEGAVRLVSDARETLLDAVLLSLAKLRNVDPDRTGTLRREKQAIQGLPPRLRRLPARLPQSEPLRARLHLDREELAGADWEQLRGALSAPP